MQVIPRSEGKTHFHLSDLVDSSTKVLVLMSRIHFWIIWRDWVKIGENFFWGQNFHKVADLIVLSTFMQVLDRKSTRLNSSHMSESRMPSSAWKKKNKNLISLQHQHTYMSPTFSTFPIPYHTYIILFVDVYALSWVTGQQAITEKGNHIISWHQPQFLEYRYNTYRPMIIKTSTVNRSRNIQAKKYTGNWAPSFYPTDTQTFFVLSSRCRWL